MPRKNDDDTARRFLNADDDVDLVVVYDVVLVVLIVYRSRYHTVTVIPYDLNTVR